MDYTLTRVADRQLRVLPLDTQRRIIKKLKFFLVNPDPLAFAKFIGRHDGVAVYRFRVGEWRVIFDFKGNSVLITEIQPRKFKRIYK